MASKHKQEDPWAGFVDVLSNILMVVIFLVVILGISIYAISQQVTKTAVQQALEKERSRSAETSNTPLAPSQNTKPAEAPETVAEKAADPDQATNPEAPAKDSGTAGERAVDMASRARQSDEIKGNTNLSVRSVNTDNSEKIEVASEEVRPSIGDVKVEQADAFLKLSFGKGSFRIDPKTSASIKAFLEKESELSNHAIEIRAFAQSTIGSVSEARRIAYYRAMQTRAELLKSGYKASNITVKVRESISPEELDAVQIFRKS
jgi:hypothetical protein